MQSLTNYFLIKKIRISNILRAHKTNTVKQAARSNTDKITNRLLRIVRFNLRQGQ